MTAVEPWTLNPKQYRAWQKQTQHQTAWAVWEYDLNDPIRHLIGSSFHKTKQAAQTTANKAPKNIIRTIEQITIHT